VGYVGFKKMLNGTGVAKWDEPLRTDIEFKASV
jgi:hypothetical protein